MRIYKYPLDVTDEQKVVMPKGARLLSVQEQDDAPCMWALVDPGAELVSRVITIHGTGTPLPTGDLGNYVGTYQSHEQFFVGHVFDKGEQR